MKFFAILTVVAAAKDSVGLQDATELKNLGPGLLQGLSLVGKAPFATINNRNRASYVDILGGHRESDVSTEYFGRSDYLVVNGVHYARNEKLGQLVKLEKKGNGFHATNIKVKSGFITDVQAFEGSIYVASFDETRDGFLTTISILEEGVFEPVSYHDGIISKFVIKAVKGKLYVFAIYRPDGGQGEKKLIKFRLEKNKPDKFQVTIKPGSDAIAIDNKSQVYVTHKSDRVRVYNQKGEVTKEILARHKVSKIIVGTTRIPALYLGGSCARNVCFSKHQDVYRGISQPPVPKV